MSKLNHELVEWVYRDSWGMKLCPSYGTELWFDAKPIQPQDVTVSYANLHVEYKKALVGHTLAFRK